MQLRLSILVLFIYFFIYYSYIESFSFRVDYNIVYRNKSDWTFILFSKLLYRRRNNFSK